MDNKPPECPGDKSDIVLSKKAAKRAYQNNDCKAYESLLTDTEGRPCIPLPPNRQCLIDNYKDEGGINGVLEDAIMFYITMIEKRAASIVRLPTLCSEERKNLVCCLHDNWDCAHKCSIEVEAFTDCFAKNGPLVLDGKIRAHRIDTKKSKKALEIYNKFNL